MMNMRNLPNDYMIAVHIFLLSIYIRNRLKNISTIELEIYTIFRFHLDRVGINV